MIRLPHLKKAVVSSAFVGAFVFFAPSADAQELPAPDQVPVVDSAGFINHIRAELAKFGVATAPVDAAITDAVDAALTPAAQQLDQVAQSITLGAEQVIAAQNYATAPLTNPQPLGIAEVLEQATQPEFVPQGIDPFYEWRNDDFSKIMAAKPHEDFVLRRVPSSYFDAPRIPHESDVAMTQGKSLYGPGTPLYINDHTICTLAVAGYDAAGRKVGITAGHCGYVGSTVASGDSWQVGPSGTVMAVNPVLDYSVIEFGSNAEVTRSYNGVTVNSVGGPIAPGAIACKQGVATGYTCGASLYNLEQVNVNHICAMVGDSGAPVLLGDRAVGHITGGLSLTPIVVDCVTPLQGALHSPSSATLMDSTLADLNRNGGVGAGFHLPV